MEFTQPKQKKGRLTEEAVYVRLPADLRKRLLTQVYRLSSSQTALIRMALTKFLEELETNK